MTGGKGHGENRQYQLECRDVLIFRNPGLTPRSDEGIDVPFQLPDSPWTIDVALRDPAGALVVAECRRTVGAVKQEDVAAFAYKVELLRKTLAIPVAGVFIAKTSHQIGAIRESQFNGIQAPQDAEDRLTVSYHDTLDLVERNLIARAIIELGRLGDSWLAICWACSMVPPFSR
jgi:hypothetical protein